MVSIGISLLLFGFLFWGNPVVQSPGPHREGTIEKRKYFWRGEKIREEIDSNFDGLTDIWKMFQKGKPVSLQMDSNFDRRRDIWVEYGKDEKITKYSADTDFDGKIDFKGSYPFPQ